MTGDGDHFLALDGGQDGDNYTVDLEMATGASDGINLIKIAEDDANFGIDQLLFLGSSRSDTIQLDTVYQRDLDATGPPPEFSTDRWTDYGEHGDGLIIAHFTEAADAYQPTDLLDEDALMQITERGLASADTTYQVVNYATVETVSMHGGAGDDKFISDDASKQFDIFGDAGNDSFFVGSVLSTETVLVAGREVTVVNEVTHGTTFPMKFYGGEDNDYFEVSHNLADIELYGDNGDDTFFIRALLTLRDDGRLNVMETAETKVSGVTERIVPLITTTTPGGAATREIQEIALGNADSGAFSLNFNGTETGIIEIGTTSAQTAANLEAALNSAPVSADVQVTVSGVTPNAFAVAFQTEGDPDEISLGQTNTLINAQNHNAVDTREQNKVAARERAEGPAEAAPLSRGGAFRLVLNTRYLLLIALLVICINW